MEAPQYHLQNVVHAKQTLEDFDGPLDVILLLLSKNKIEIQDISISSILEQYLAWLDERKRMDMEVASEFIAMASHLMYIKTRMLLSEAEKAEAESEMEELIASLRQRQRKDAYEQIKIACGALALRNDIGLGMFPKQPEPLAPGPDVPLSARAGRIWLESAWLRCRTGLKEGSRRRFPILPVSSAPSRIRWQRRLPRCCGGSLGTA